MALGRFKRRQYFVSKWFVNLHLTVIFIVPIDVVTCIYMYFDCISFEKIISKKSKFCI